MSTVITKEFEPSSAAAWKQKIQADLEGEDYNQTLLTNSNEGIRIKPFYHLDIFEKIDIPVKDGDFKVCQKIIISSEKEANLEAIKAIKKGADAIKFIVSKPINASILFEKLLDKNIDFHFIFSFLSEEFVCEIASFLKDETAFYNIDIIGNLAKEGNWYHSMKEDFKIVQSLLDQYPSSFMLGVQLATYANAGANTVQQVAYALAHVNEYLNYFGADIASKIQFNFAVGSNYFFEISKIRAFKHVFNLVLSKYNTSANAIIFAEPCIRNKTLFDNNVNLLRTTTECMSAILGGADTVSNSAYDEIFNTSSDFGSRIARNQLLILKEESYFKNAQHIATDSYYIESLTKKIAEKALEIFKAIEKSDGFLHQLKEGTIQRKISENAQKEQVQFDAGELVLLGTNKYPDKNQKLSDELHFDPFLKKMPRKTLITPIIIKRLSETLEQKRLKNEA